MAAKKASTNQVVDGQLEAVRLLRALEKLNWNGNRRRKSAKALMDAMLASNAWPAKERGRFAGAIAEWLTDMVLGCVPDLNRWERASHAKAMRTDADFRNLMASVVVDACRG